MVLVVRLVLVSIHFAMNRLFLIVAQTHAVDRHANELHHVDGESFAQQHIRNSLLTIVLMVDIWQRMHQCSPYLADILWHNFHRDKHDRSHNCCSKFQVLGPQVVDTLILLNREDSKQSDSKQCKVERRKRAFGEDKIVKKKMNHLRTHEVSVGSQTPSLPLQ